MNTQNHFPSFFTRPSFSENLPNYSMSGLENDYESSPEWMLEFLETELSTLPSHMEWIRPDVLDWIDEYRQMI